MNTINVIPSIRGIVDLNGNVYMDRQGCSTTRLIAASDFSMQMDFGKVPDSKELQLYADVSVNDQRKKFSGVDAGEQAIEFVNSELGTKYRLSKLTLGYVYGHATYNYQNDDVFITPVRYESATDTIRHVPSNYCLVAFEEGKFDLPLFDVDQANEPYRSEVIRAYEKGIYDHDRKHGDDYCKRRVAWLAGRYILEAQNRPTPCVITGRDMEYV